MTIFDSALKTWQSESKRHQRNSGNADGIPTFFCISWNWFGRFFSFFFFCLFLYRDLPTVLSSNFMQYFMILQMLYGSNIIHSILLPGTEACSSAISNILSVTLCGKLQEVMTLKVCTCADLLYFCSTMGFLSHKNCLTDLAFSKH